jgi:hypothetical protein
MVRFADRGRAMATLEQWARAVDALYVKHLCCTWADLAGDLRIADSVWLRGLATDVIWRAGGRRRKRRFPARPPQSQAESASDSRRFNMSGSFRTSQINAAAFRTSEVTIRLQRR